MTQNKDTILKVPLSEQERADCQSAATAQGLTLTAFVRMAALRLARGIT